MLDHETHSVLTKLSRELRQDVLMMAKAAGGAHISPAYSMLDILTVFYFGSKAQTINGQSKYGSFILSKGHACAALYAVLAKLGLIKRKELGQFCKSGSILGGHPDMNKIPGIEASTGSLGHGVVFGAGLALAKKLRNQKTKVFVMMGDGEMQEGSVWETVLFAGSYKLSNLVLILDYNKLQGMGPIHEIVNLEPLDQKFKAFGWDVILIDGHNFEEIESALDQSLLNKRPTLIISNTIKGKGLPVMEGKTIWHYKLPKGDDWDASCALLGIPNVTPEEWFS